MTERLYYDNPEIKEFSAAVTQCFPYKDGNFAVVLNKTYFYPESGGQLGDRGFIDAIPVDDVVVQGDDILHITKIAIEQNTVQCRIDDGRRADLTCQHTGQHLISALFLKQLSAATVGFHMSDTYSTIDLECDVVRAEQLADIELQANKAVMANKAVRSFWIRPEDIEKYPIRKIGKFSERVRLVEIEDNDVSMCGGTHVLQTASIGPIRFIASERVKGGLLRLSFLCGERAVRFGTVQNETLQRLKKMTSLPEEEIITGIEKIMQDKELMHKQSQAMVRMLLEIKVNTTQGQQYVIDATFDLGKNAQQTYAAECIKKGALLAAIYDPKEQFLVISQAPSKPFDLKTIGAGLIGAYSAKGGGSDTVFQIMNIVLADPEQEIRKVFAL